MSREGTTAIVVAFTILVVAAMIIGWLRRRRRDSGYDVPVGQAPEGAVFRSAHDGFYVATTRHDEPLERLALPHLGFRARADVVITDRGLTWRLQGEPDIFVARDRLRGVGRATWTIDRVVERDGLVLIAWAIDEEGTIADSYFRFETGVGAVVDEVLALLPAAYCPPEGGVAVDAIPEAAALEAAPDSVPTDGTAPDPNPTDPNAPAGNDR